MRGSRALNISALLKVTTTIITATYIQVQRTLNLQYHRHNQRTFLRLLGNVALQISADFFLDHAIVSFLFFAGVRQCVFDDALCSVHEAVFSGVEAARDDLWRSFHSACKFVDGDD